MAVARSERLHSVRGWLKTGANASKVINIEVGDPGKRIHERGEVHRGRTSEMVYSTKPVAPKAHEPRYCIHCRRPLQAVGHARKNGKRTHADWKGRKYHKRCLKLLRRAGW